MTERERALLQGKKISPLTANESAIAYAVAHGGGSEPTYETVAEIQVGEMEQTGSVFEFVFDDATPPTINTAETYYLNDADNPSTIVWNEDGAQAIIFNSDSVEDFSPIEEDKPVLVVSWVDGECHIGSNNKDSFSNTTVRILKKVEQGGLPENIKPTYEFDFSAEPEESSFTVTPASGVTYAAIASALAETPHVFAKITFPSAMGLVVYARFNESITGDGQTVYYANELVIMGSDPTAIGLTIGENAGQTVCVGTLKNLAVAT